MSHSCRDKESFIELSEWISKDEPSKRMKEFARKQAFANVRLSNLPMTLNCENYVCAMDGKITIKEAFKDAGIKTDDDK